MDSGPSVDTMSSVFRLLDLKVEPYLVASSLDLILAQRLVRVLCENCKRAVRVSPGQATRLGRWLGGKTEIFASTGCARCLRTGYRGRRAIFELLDFNDDLRDLVLHSPSIAGIKKIIEGEDARKPLSDSKIVSILQKEGLILARRTIAKYREELKIPTSNQRKVLY